MNRNDVPVSAERAELNRGTFNRAFVEVDDAAAYDSGRIEGAMKLQWSKELQNGCAATSSTEPIAQLRSDRGILDGDVVLRNGDNNARGTGTASSTVSTRSKLLDGRRCLPRRRFSTMSGPPSEYKNLVGALPIVEIR